MRVLGGLVVGAVVVATASCGARSGLWLGAGPAGDAGAGGAGSGGPIDGGAEEGGVPCIPGAFTLERGTAKVLLVVDRSGSMALALDSSSAPLPGEPSRWDALRSAVGQAITPFDGEVELGATFFPTAFDTMELSRGCGVAESEDIAPGLGNGPVVLHALHDGVPFGGTPTVEALRAARRRLAEARGAVRAIVLATDGAPNCNDSLNPVVCTCATTGAEGCEGTSNGMMCLDDVRAVATVSAIASEDKIPVYVLGLADPGPGSAAFTRTLDAMAVAGGRARAVAGQPRYIPARSAGELTTALASVRAGVARCTFLTPSAPEGEAANDARVVVTLDGAEVPRDPARREGWDWVDQRYGQLALFGAWCEQAARSASVPAARVRCE